METGQRRGRPPNWPMRRARAWSMLALSAVVGVHSAALAQPFVDVSAAAGFTEAHASEPFEGNCAPSPLECATPFSGGVTVGDYDADGDPDLFVTRYELPDGLYENQGDGTFIDVAAIVGVAGQTDGRLGRTNGALFVDVDNDGDQDLVVSAFAERFHLYINDGLSHTSSGGRPHFTDEAAARGIDLDPDGPPQLGGFSIAAGDYDRDGWVDLYTTSWMAFAGQSCEDNNTRLFRGWGTEAPGHFVDVTVAAGAGISTRRNPIEHAFSAAFADMDGDGLQDLVVASDFGTSHLLWNRGDGAFADGTRAAGVGTDENGMGSSIADFDGDGDLDWFVSAISPGADISGWEASSGNRLYRNDGGRRFTDVSLEAGVRSSSWGWGAVFFDADHDQDPDLLVTNGYQFLGAESDITRYYEQEAGHTFRERAGEVGLADDGLGRGAVVLDYDQDGDQDVFIARNTQTPLLLRNDGGAALGDWLRVRATGQVGTRDAYGTQIMLVAEQGASAARFAPVDSTSQFLGESERVAHFGLGPGVAGAGKTFRVEARFLSGHVVVQTGVAPNQEVTLTEPALDAPRGPVGDPPEHCAGGVRQPCEQDCDHSDTADACDLQNGAPDCNDNAVIDSCEVASGLATDCDGNDVLDSCELQDGSAEDCDSNGTIDSCELLADGSVDRDANGVIDACELQDAGVPSQDGGVAGGIDAGVDGSESDAGVGPDADAAVTVDCGVSRPPPDQGASTNRGVGCSAVAPDDSAMGWLCVAWLLVLRTRLS